MLDQPHTRIFIEDLLIQVPAGFAPWEKHPGHPVPLLVSVDMFTGRTDWPDTRLENLIDYTRVHDYLMTWPGRAHVESLEALCQDLLAFCFQDDRIQACRVLLKKPQVFPYGKGAGVEIYRQRASGVK